MSTLSAVQVWNKKIRSARERWDKDAFCRMRENMEFAAGYQWQGQDRLDDDRYISNLVLRLVNQKVASLYARNPKVSAQRRKRLDFQIWDGRMESIQQAVALTSLPNALPEDVMAASALLADYAEGRRRRDLIDRIGQTLEILFSWNLANQMPSFKVQMKQLVRRVITCGVGYVRLNFSRDFESTLSTSDTESTIVDRAKTAQMILNKVMSGEITEESPDIVTLQSLFASMNVSMALGDSSNIKERLVFDFPPATSVIPDPQCRALKGFVGARWVAQEYILPLDEVNAFFETNISPGGDLKLYSADGRQTDGANQDYSQPGMDQQVDPCRVCLWEVFDLQTKSRFFICDGWKDFVLAPEPVMPDTNHFWPLFPLTFNDVEVEPGQQKASIFPPSDVQIAKSSQKEWNRTREGLREQRKANAPKYLTGKGWLTETDRDNLQNAVPNSVIEVEGAQPGQDIGKLLAPFQHAPIDPMAYDTAPLNQDIFLSLGNEEATQPASAKGTATAATINEQARLVVTASNVDDLDDLLSDLAEAGGEILLRELSVETVVRVCGAGAVWPEADREDYVDHLFLDVVAASSGRPNRALELANFQQIAPTLIAAGANPHFIVREALKRLDDRLESDEAFPLGPVPAMTMAAATSSPAAAPATSANPPRGISAPTTQGQMPAATVKRPSLPNRSAINES